MQITTPQKWVLGGLTVGAICAAVYYLSLPDVLAAQPSVVTAAGKPQSARPVPADGLQWMGAVPQAAATMQDDPRPFVDVVNALVATRNPADALRAYGIVQGCELNREGMFKLESTPPILVSYKTRCASIPDVMRRSRFDYLRTAAYAGVPGVGSDWFRHGLAGGMETLKTRPNDPSVIEWKAQAIALVIRDGDQGDFDALQDLMQGYAGKSPAFDADPSRELAYAMAYKEVVDLLKLEMIPNRPTDEELNALAARLSPEQLAWAKAKADAILSARRKRSG